MNSKPLQVWLVDDDASIRWVLEKALKGSGMAAKCFDQADNVLSALRSDAPDVLMTDIRMPGRSGLDLLKEIQVSRPGLPVIVMTGHGDVPLAVEAMKLGALDFLEKPFEDERLLSMIEAALSQNDSETKNDAVMADLASRLASLTQRERQVMEGLVTGQSNKQIAREYDISPRTVEVYRANVMTKMQAGNLSELVRFAIRAGILND